ncbi:MULTISPECIES: hypothetical protein [Flavobacterium]|uniref:hypothetical protein n=1 Tax=Flavobacterium TaxID=237 RepID=UPI001FCAA770|nr:MULTISPECIES: hypothetical protein [Flavobacterium]UOK42702.1 hypothetical protein LZF87_00885 [Flavobacterium enshiense]
MKNIINILALLFITNNFVHGQSTRTITPINQINTIEESVYLHCNTTTLLCGETLLLKAYTLNTKQKTLDAISKIAYVELLDNRNSSVLKQKIVLKNGTGQGDFFIPTSLKTGNYKLIAYTNWTLNKREKGIFKTDIFIINPFERIPLEESALKQPSNSSLTEKKENSIQSNSSLLSLRTDKSKYAAREKISLTIQSNLKSEIKGNFSISIRKTDSLPDHKRATSIDFLNMVASQDNSNTEKSRFLPEMRGEIISGKISSKDSSKSLKDKIVSISIPGKYFGIKIAKTDENGKFNLILDEHPEASEAIIQIVENDRKEYAVALEETIKPDFSMLTTVSPLQLNPKNKIDIENRSIANQIENSYFQKKKDSLAEISKTTPFFHPLEKEYILDDYTRFPNLKETIVEVLDGVYYTKNENGYSIRLRTSSSQEDSFGEALVMVDGLLIQDNAELFDYDTQNIYKVSLVNHGYVYGSKIFTGIINFVTKKNDYETKTSGDFIKTVVIDRPQRRKKYFFPNYAENDFARIPDYRYQLLWEPEIFLNRQETSLSFFASDVKGQFEISLEGFTEKGDPVSLKEFITVE